MKTLELKDICGYLPYGLKYQWTNMKSVRLISMTDEVDYSSQHSLSTAWEWMMHRQARPILRPMSDLTKEITHRGEKFVPLVELAKIALRDAIAKRYYNDVDFVIKNDYVEIHGHYKFRYTHRGSFEMCRTISDFDELTCLHQCEIFDKLNEWMFDYRGLISAGLAIDVNTLPENPYER